MEAFQEAALLLICFIDDPARPRKLSAGNVPPDLRYRSRQLPREGGPANHVSQSVWYDRSVLDGGIDVSRLGVYLPCSMLTLPSKGCGWRSVATFTQHFGLHVCCYSPLGSGEGILDYGDNGDLVWSVLLQLCRSKKSHGSSSGGRLEPPE